MTQIKKLKQQQLQQKNREKEEKEGGAEVQNKCSERSQQ